MGYGCLRMRLSPERIQVQTDFDGTVTEKDVMIGLNEHFSDESWNDIVGRWERREVTTREALLEMYSMIRATPEVVRDFVHTWVRIREGFPEFMQWCRKMGIEVVIVSEGLDFVIEETLAMIGVEATVITNRAVFGDPFMSVEFPETPPICEHDDGDICGTCKVAHVTRARAAGKYVIYIGDGTTDVRPAREADLVFARRALAERLPRFRDDMVRFEDFHTITGHLRALIEGD